MIYMANWRHTNFLSFYDIYIYITCFTRIFLITLIFWKSISWVLFHSIWLYFTSLYLFFFLKTKLNWKPRAAHRRDSVTVNFKELERVDSVKVLGVTITSTLQRNCHIADDIKKANKRMYCLILLIAPMFQQAISSVSILLV